jgi:hypothetical protein
MVLVISWTAAAALLLSDGLLDVFQYPSTTLLDGGEVIVGAALAILLALWLRKHFRR